MLCQSCGKNEASVHITQMVGGHIQETHLCAVCAAGSETGLGDLLAGLMEDAPEKTKPCPKCGVSFRQVQKEGRLGCPYCYTHFRSALSPLLSRVQGDGRHKGRIPSGSPEVRKERELKRLRERMALAVAREEFEAAAVLRDTIRAVEAGGVPNADMAD